MNNVCHSLLKTDLDQSAFVFLIYVSTKARGLLQSFATRLRMCSIGLSQKKKPKISFKCMSLCRLLLYSDISAISCCHLISSLLRIIHPCFCKENVICSCITMRNTSINGLTQEESRCHFLENVAPGGKPSLENSDLIDFSPFSKAETKGHLYRKAHCKS